MSAPKLSQVAYTRFKESLFARRIRPGAVMSQAELSEIVGVPIGPLRDAVQILQSEGLLTVMPRSGIRIAKPDLELIRNAFQLRRLLEREAVARFAEQGPIDMLERQARTHLDMIASTEAADAEALPGPRKLWDFAVDVDSGLHEMLIDFLGNPLIASVFERIYCQIKLVRLDTQYVLSGVLIRRTMQEHLQIIDALRRRDAEAAMRAMDDHLVQAMQRAMWL